MRHGSEDGNRKSEVRDQKSDMETKQIKSAKDLRVYKKAYALGRNVNKLERCWVPCLIILCFFDQKPLMFFPDI